MNGLRVLVVDDEQPARRKLRNFLKDEGCVAAVLEAADGLEAVKQIRAEKPDLVFLDVQMPGRDGFEVIETVGTDHMPAVVFVTAYDQYALQAFEVEAMDYLLKPFDQARFRKSFEKAVKKIQLKNDNALALKNIVEEIQKQKKYLQRIMVNRGPHYYFIKTADIVLISAAEKYVEVKTEKASYLVRETMNRMEELLDPSHFVRIHRSAIINVDELAEIQPWSHGDSLVLLKNGSQLTLSRRFRGRLFLKP